MKLPLIFCYEVKYQVVFNFIGTKNEEKKKKKIELITLSFLFKPSFLS